MTQERILELAQEAQILPDVIEGMVSAEVGAKYHAFLGLLAQDMQPERIVELGGYIGESTKYMAQMCPTASIVMIDINPDAKRQIDQIEPILSNIKAITDGATWISPQYDGQLIDLLFLDINHDFSATHTAYEAWKDLVKPGGVIVIDDIHLDTETERFNNYLIEKGINLIDIPNVHPTGFGVIINA